MSAAPLWLCGSVEEAERFCEHGFDALDGSEERARDFWEQYRERQVIVTPTGRDAAYGAAVVLHALCKCKVEALTNGADLDAEDPATLPRVPMFTESKSRARRMAQSTRPASPARLAANRVLRNWLKRPKGIPSRVRVRNAKTLVVNAGLNDGNAEIPDVNIGTRCVSDRARSGQSWPVG